MLLIFKTRFFGHFTAAFLIGLIMTPQVGYGKMAASSSVPVEKVILALEKKASTGPTSTSEQELLVMIKVGQLALGLKKITVTGSGTDDVLIGRVSFDDVRNSLSAAILRHPAWDWQIPADAKKAITRAHRGLLVKHLAMNPYERAWFQYQLGEKDDAKRTLSNLYDTGFTSVMSLKSAVYGFNGGPLNAVQNYFQALEPMCDETTRETLRAKMQKMKIHVSNLPQSHIKT